MLLTLLFNFEGGWTVKYFLLSIDGKIDEKEYVVNYLQENSNDDFHQLGPTWTNGRWRSLIFSRLHLKPKQVKECLDVEVENHRNLNLFLSQEWVVAHKKDTHVCSIQFQETCVRLLVASKLRRLWRPKGSVLLGRRFWYLDLCQLLVLSMYSHSKGHTWSFLVVNQADAE